MLKRKSAGFPAPGFQSGHVKSKSTKFFVNGDPDDDNGLRHSST